MSFKKIRIGNFKVGDFVATTETNINKRRIGEIIDIPESNAFLLVKIRAMYGKSYLECFTQDDLVPISEEDFNLIEVRIDEEEFI